MKGTFAINDDEYSSDLDMPDVRHIREGRYECRLRFGFWTLRHRDDGGGAGMCTHFYVFGPDEVRQVCFHSSGVVGRFSLPYVSAKRMGAVLEILILEGYGQQT
jgi:hypothetical protein